MRDNITMVGFYLVILAFVLIIIEAHIPSFGVLGITAVISLLVGGKIIVDAGGIFGIPLDWPIFIGLATGMIIVTTIASRIVIHSLKKKPISGIEGMIGGHVHIVEWSQTEGLVMAQGELWRAVSLHPHSFQSGDIAQIGAAHELILHIHPKD